MTQIHDGGQRVDGRQVGQARLESRSILPVHCSQALHSAKPDPICLLPTDYYAGSQA